MGSLKTEKKEGNEQELELFRAKRQVEEELIKAMMKLLRRGWKEGRDEETENKTPGESNCNKEIEKLGTHRGNQRKEHPS